MIINIVWGIRTGGDDDFLMVYNAKAVGGVYIPTYTEVIIEYSADGVICIAMFAVSVAINLDVNAGAKLILNK